MGMILVAHVSFYFFAFMHSFSKISFRFWPFSNPTVVKEISIKKALTANECVRRIEAIIANNHLGHPLYTVKNISVFLREFSWQSGTPGVPFFLQPEVKRFLLFNSIPVIQQQHRKEEKKKNRKKLMVSVR